jgi:spermidine synthase
VAVIWSQRLQGRLYEVRSAGHSIRLYTDGVFHSQYNPKRPLSHGVWDLLMLPALYYPEASIRRILVLGVGGGAVIRLLRQFIEPEEIIGIELNPVHLKIARRFFGVTKKMATLIQADAIEWLRAYQGPAFDMIIDDLFGEVDGEPQRVVPLNNRWCQLLTRHLSQDGVLVINSMSARQLRESALVSKATLSKQYPSKIQLSLPLYENSVGAFFKTEINAKTLQTGERRLLRAFRQLDYRWRRIGGKIT